MRAAREFWGVTILLFIVLTVLVAAVVRMMSYYKKYHRVTHPKALLSRTPIKSGDVILFVAHTHGLTNSIITWDLYSHSGMAVEIDGVLYISESTIDQCDSMRDLNEGARLNELLPRLRRYPGLVYLMPLAEPLSAEQEATLRERASVRAPYPGGLDMLRALLRLPSKKSRHCMQHVAWLIDELGLTPDELKTKKMLDTGFFGSSRAVTGLPGKPLGGGRNRYLDITQLMCD